MKFIYSNNAKKAIKKLNEPIKSRIRTAIENLPGGDVKTLKGNKSLNRLRVGKYRIIFKKVDDVIEIDKIQKRNDIYKTGV